MRHGALRLLARGDRPRVVSKQLIGVGVLGAGRIGERVVGYLRSNPRVGVLAVYNRSPERLGEVAARFGAKAFDSWEALLGSHDIDLVLVTTSNDLHAVLATSALQHHKAVLCEKPMATSASDAVAMVQTARHNEMFLQIGFELRYSRLYRTVRRWIDDGLLGEVVLTSCSYISSAFWLPGAWRARPEHSGGVVGEKLSHYIDIARWWTDAAVLEVYAAAAPNVVPAYGVHDNVQLTMRFVGGAVSHISFAMGLASWTPTDPLQHPEPHFRDSGHELRNLVQGTRGAAMTDVFGRVAERWSLDQTTGHSVSKLVEQVEWRAEDDEEYFHNIAGEVSDVVARVAEGRLPLVPPEDALASTLACFAAEESLATGRPVSLADIAGRTGLSHTAWTGSESPGAGTDG